ncbi:AAA domain-containing protein [Algivirga pacifica]|uniref:AAA domain-containing protein n=1 Tax=Algivirga pacifica TaxID=1162670 RepID=A0ABP9D2S0_9BACT
MEHPIAIEFFDELYILHQEERLHMQQKFIKLKTLLEQICKDLTRDEPMHMSNLFARISYLGNKKKLDKRLLWQLHRVRMTANRVRKRYYTPDQQEWLFAVATVTEALSILYAESNSTPLDIPPKLKDIRPERIPYQVSAREIGERIEKIRVVVLQKLEDEACLLCVEESAADEETVKVRYDVPQDNLEYTTTIHHLWEGAQLNLLDVYTDESGCYVPRHFVVEPDYLVDVTAVAECFQKSGVNTLLNLNRKFEQTEATAAMQLGNVANFFLDELLNESVQDPLNFEETFKKTFQQYPVQYSAINDLQDKESFMKFYQRAQIQFTNIRKVVREDLKTEGINEDNCYIEPSFISEKYGFQGRLDLLHFNEKDGEPHFDIFELKSSSSVPSLELGRDGMWVNHKTQALIYRMLLQSAFQVKPEQVNPSIFYSSVNAQNLRFAPSVQSLEKEILNARNIIVCRDLQLAQSPHGESASQVLRLISERKFQGAPPFVMDKVRHFEHSLRSMSILEREYLFSFVSFIAKEQQLSKIGDTEFRQGMAALWLEGFDEKAEAFNIFYDLEIEENHADAEKPHIIFKRTNEENNFVNFREGDIAVLYPRSSAEDHALKNQIFKCSIVSITKDHITVRFRFRQRNLSFFNLHQQWALEHDVLDNSFASMYKGLFSFLSETSKQKKDVLLGMEKPKRAPLVTDFYTEDVLNEEEKRIIGKALAAEDYFLVVGPPGTGKTSRMLKNLTANLHKDPQQNILLLAYTNRAVDEICEAVDMAIEEKADGERKFIRIGSEFSTAEQWRPCLLDKVAAAAKNRAELKEMIQKHRIFVGTLASITGKLELFKLKDFDIAIVDEASQILEPQIVGLLPKVRRFVLIGDQKQLPAIVQQEAELSAVKQEELHSIGLFNRRNSYFERIFNRCQENGWEWAFDMLTHQGRMHQELSVFSNQSFYDNKLTTVPLPWQHATLSFDKVDQENKYERMLSEHRLLFIPSRKKSDDKSDKINSDEALMVVELVKAVKSLYLSNGKGFDPLKTIGIITPYRNQIAQIKHELEQAGIEEADKLTIDTVERYQGSQREVIIISFCANTPFQVKNLMSLTDDGVVDRKLNVAITRARQQMIFVGNEELLSRETIFYRLIEWVKSRDGYIHEEIPNMLKHDFQLPKERLSTGVELIPEDVAFEKAFEKVVYNVVQQHPATEGASLMGADDHFLRNIVLAYGRTIFDEPYEHEWEQFCFSAEDKVNAYAYFNMQKHFYSGKYVLGQIKDQLAETLAKWSNRLFFFDIGCGPMTAGLAFNQVMQTTRKHFVFNYIGVDHSQAMLAKAKEFSEQDLLERTTYCSLVSRLEDINWGYVQDCFAQPHVIILNFSHVMEVFTLEETLVYVDVFKRMMSRFPQNRYYVVYQSTLAEQESYNYKHFLERLNSNYQILTNGKAQVKGKGCSEVLYDQQEEVYYEWIAL